LGWSGNYLCLLKPVQITKEAWRLGFRNIRWCVGHYCESGFAKPAEIPLKLGGAQFLKFGPRLVHADIAAAAA